MARFIRLPWASTGDRAEVPFPTDPGGAVSYTQGFGPDYEIAPGDAGWKPVPRPETNGYLYDITDNLRQYQLNGVPAWYAAADNGGVPVNYPLNARVRHNDVVYRSAVVSNTMEPGAPGSEAAWLVDTLWGQASTTVVGVSRLATLAEARAKSAADIALTPAGLAAAQLGIANQTVFTANGTFNVPAGVTKVYAKVIGGGGGGGNPNTSYRHGGGGGGGGVAEGFIAVTPGAAMAVVVGSGGAAGANGGNSSFGGLTGGGGGRGGNADGSGVGGQSGSGSGGTINYGLGDGSFGNSSTDINGAGNGGGPGGAQGRAGRGPGGGGGGGYDSGGAGSQPAGAGSPGIVIIMY